MRPAVMLPKVFFFFYESQEKSNHIYYSEQVKQLKEWLRTRYYEISCFPIPLSEMSWEGIAMVAEPNGCQREHLDKDRRYSEGIL